MWAQPNHIGPYSVEAYDRRQGNGSIRVAIIPLDDVESLVERAAKVIYVTARRCDGMDGPYTWETTFQCVRDAYLNDARAALTAAGIPCKQRRARK